MWITLIIPFGCELTSLWRTLCLYKWMWEYYQFWGTASCVCLCVFTMKEQMIKSFCRTGTKKQGFSLTKKGMVFHACYANNEYSLQNTSQQTFQVWPFQTLHSKRIFIYLCLILIFIPLCTHWGSYGSLFMQYYSNESPHLRNKTLTLQLTNYHNK